jgi:cyclopropane fatty-acyl-phospholipid synthase-like methyltransferase
MSTPVRTQGPQPGEQVMQLATGFMASAALYTAAQLGVADLLKDGAKSTQELAEQCEANEDALYRLMRALASVGVFCETSPRVFELTAVGELLRADRDDSSRDMVLWMANMFHFETYPEMTHAVKTGETVVEKVYGYSCFDYFEKDREVGDVFNTAMTNFSRAQAPVVLEAYDFSWLNGKTLVDVGGGQGHLLTAILKKYPEMRGVIFDLQRVLPGAKQRIAEAGLVGRCEAVAGDFFAAVPAGDAYIMQHIIHDWNDENALTILRNCHRAGRSDAKVILVESVLTPGNEPGFAKWLDLEMLLLPGGRERSEEEFARLLEGAGFALTRVVQTKSAARVLEAQRRD